jgi:lactobin A/cerein 7B family class IIb bacteriocin
MDRTAPCPLALARISLFHPAFKGIQALGRNAMDMSNLTDLSSFEALDPAALAEIDGGIGPFVAGFIVGSAFVAGVYVGIQLAKNS